MDNPLAPDLLKNALFYFACDELLSPRARALCQSPALSPNELDFLLLRQACFVYMDTRALLPETAFLGRRGRALSFSLPACENFFKSGEKWAEIKGGAPVLSHRFSSALQALSKENDSGFSFSFFLTDGGKTLSLSALLAGKATPPHASKKAEGRFFTVTLCKKGGLLPATHLQMKKAALTAYESLFGSITF